jgi:hypothetical protein
MDTCTWTLDDWEWEYWETACDYSFMFNHESPDRLEGNEFVYCPKCGKVIVWARPDGLDEEE